MNREEIKNKESEVRSYCRKYTDTFGKAKGVYMYSDNGEKYLDFLAGAGALNYGHNNDYIKKEVLDYIENDGLIHGLDIFTCAKERFIGTLEERILKPRNLDYKIQFCGSTGTNAVEAALKLARKVKKRSNVIAFSGAFHGMSLGSLSLTSDEFSRNGGGVNLTNVSHMPYPVGCGANFDTIEYLDNVLHDDHSGIDKPCAIILETVQAEGGINVAPIEWLQRLENLCHENDILLIVDDIQVGNSRTGTFFSFERASITPDIVVLSKSIGGYGFPMSILLFKPELDIWKPAEHNGTFRGNQIAFIAGASAINYNVENNLSDHVKEMGDVVEKYINENILCLDNRMELRGIGLIWGIDFSRFKRPDIVKELIHECYNNHLIIEAAGRNDLVLKLLPPLVITREELMDGLEIIKNAIIKVLGE